MELESAVREPIDLAAHVRERGHPAADRARILLDATSAFLACDDLDDVGRAIGDAIRELFAPDKASVAVTTADGTVRLIAADGYAAEQLEQIREAVASRAGVLDRVLGGEELWSTDGDAGPLRERLALYGVRAGFALPIASPAGVIGLCSGIYLEERGFSDDFRNDARSLVAQAGLALALFASRDAERRAASELGRRHRASAAMLAVAGDLALVTDPAAIPARLATAIREASGARSASVARRVDDDSGFVLVAADGFDGEQEALVPGVSHLVDPSGMAELRNDRPVVRGAGSSAGDGRAGSALSVSAPILGEAGVWGFMTIDEPQDAADVEDLVSLVSGFASIAASAIARAEAVAEVERQQRRSDTLLELSSSLAGAQDHDVIARTVSAFVRRASGAPFALVARRRPRSDRFDVVGSEGFDSDQLGRIREALATTDLPSLRDLLGGAVTAREEPPGGEGIGIGSAIAVPILVDRRTDGFIAVGSGLAGAIDSTDWQELLTAFAALTATAFARADAVADLATQRDVLAAEVDERTRTLRTALDELRIASDAKTDFLANVSHELRTPLTAILGFSEILAGEGAGSLSDGQLRDVETITSNSLHLLELIDDLIDIASIEAGRMDLEITPVPIADVIDSAVQRMQSRGADRGVQLVMADSVDRARDEGRRVCGDRQRLDEILLSLLSNAIKFTGRDGTVVVDVLDRELQGRPGERPGVAVAVRDSGIGIQPDDRDRIFDRFVRSDDLSIPGTGLGLSISRELARLHGGDLTLESPPGPGSTFVLRLPEAPA